MKSNEMSYVLLIRLPRAIIQNIWIHSKVRDRDRRAKHRDAITRITRSPRLLILTLWPYNYASITAMLRVNDRKCIIGSIEDYEDVSSFYRILSELTFSRSVNVLPHRRTDQRGQRGQRGVSEEI